MIRNTTKLQKFGWVLFLMYLIALTYFMFFAESFGRTPNTQSGYAYNLESGGKCGGFYAIWFFPSSGQSEREKMVQRLFIRIFVEPVH